MNAQVLNLSRRSFLKAGALAGGGLILGVFMPGLARSQEPAASDSDLPFAPNAFVRIGRDGTVTVVANHSEMGQGIYTGLAMMMAEELDAEWSKVRVESAPVDPIYNHTVYGMQGTGGSTSTWTEWERVRRAGATARAMLVQAAANVWKVDPSECRTENGRVLCEHRVIAYGGLVETAAKLAVPGNVATKDPKDYKLIGKSTPRLDTPSKTDGTARFGLDVNLPGMLVATVARPPVFGGKLKTMRLDAARAVKGVKNVFAMSRGVAVVADGFWAAKKGRDALDLEWEDGPLGELNSDAQAKEYAELAKAKDAAIARDGDADKALASAAKTVEAVFALPYLAHSPMEPLNAVADVRPDGCDVWTGTQFQTVDHAVATAVSGLPPEKVKIHTTLLGGGFGRRAVFDGHFVAEAVEISKEMKAPVKVVWTREDDVRGGFYRPAVRHEIKAGVDANGDIAGWSSRIVCQSFAMGTPMEGGMVRNGVDELAVEGTADTHYHIPNFHVSWKQAPNGVPTLWFRSVGHTHTAFAMESVIDDLAHAAGKDPVEFRRALLKEHPRSLDALNLAAEKAEWGKPAPAGQARGVAVHESFGSSVAMVVDASVDKNGRPRVHRAVVAIDCGPVVNPQQVEAQMESCVVVGLSACLFGGITFDKGRVQQSNFHDYPMLRVNEMPVVETHIVPSDKKMGGVGEPGVPPVAPAVANALFALTGKRVRHQPFQPSDFA